MSLIHNVNSRQYINDTLNLKKMIRRNKFQTNLVDFVAVVVVAAVVAVAESDFAAVS